MNNIEKLPKNLKHKIKSNQLSVDDLINNISLFKNIPISKIIKSDEIIELCETLGDTLCQIGIEMFPGVFNYIIKGDLTRQFTNYFNLKNNIELTNIKDSNQKLEYLLKSFFLFNNKLDTREQLLYYQFSFFDLCKNQKKFIEFLGLDNVKKFEFETHFFSRFNTDSSNYLEMFSSYFAINTYKFNDFSLENPPSYEIFIDRMAYIMEKMKKDSLFDDYFDYGWLTGDIKDKHPELFISENAPEELKTAFYRHSLYPLDLQGHQEYIPFLIGKDVGTIINNGIELRINESNLVDFNKEFISHYGEEKFLKLFVKYGGFLTNLSLALLDNEIEDELKIEKEIRKSIYQKILNSKFSYYNLINILEMKKEYPEIFINLKNIKDIPLKEAIEIENCFYTRGLTYDTIKKYPILISILKEKNLFIPFGNKDGNHYDERIYLTKTKLKKGKTYSDLELLQIFGNEKFLKLCYKYGNYLELATKYLNQNITIKNGKYINNLKEELSFEDINNLIEKIIIRQSLNGNIAYTLEDAPNFLKENYPQLFLDNSAPKELKFCLYNNEMSFQKLNKHPEWLPFLKDKAIITFILKNDYLKKETEAFIKLFGEEAALKIGISKPETVEEMLKQNKVALMKKWYDKTGQKFIPDFVIMQKIKIEESDKFLNNTSKWSSLVQVKNFSENIESKEAVFNLAYTFGVFDNDMRGYKKLKELLTGLPKRISINQGYIIDRIDEQINIYKNNPKNLQLNKVFTSINLYELFNNIEKEKVNIDFSKNIFSQIYVKNNDYYMLTINQQKCPKTTQIIRSILEQFAEIPILTPSKAHQLFSAFEVRYDADYREFLLSNFEQIINNSEYSSLVSTIQTQFKEIKMLNSNRKLTFDLAVSYVKANKFTSVNIGNEKVAEISSMVGYSQKDFDILQQIYNCSKQRIFSSIPRIERTTSKYSYEMLRLDDPLALAIGTLTDCCQEIRNNAEVCMEHSIVDKNGRVFVIKDNLGNIVAQSWVWRNKDVLCFDNIEIPNKAFIRAKEVFGLDRNEFTDEIYNIYKEVAHNLIEIDKINYANLLEKGKITKNEYEGLRLGKITVGLGYNDIAVSIQKQALLDKGIISRPLPFKEPIKLSKTLYTNDSMTQYILEERQNRIQFEGEAMPIYSDKFIEYDDSNFTEKHLLLFQKLEFITKNNPINFNTLVYNKSNHLISQLAKNYQFNPITTRIVMNSTLGMIYSKEEDKIKIGDLFFNLKVDNGEQQLDIENEVVTQIRLILEQISDEMNIDVSNLDEKQMEIYSKSVRQIQNIDKCLVYKKTYRN